MSLSEYSRACPNCQTLVRNPLKNCTSCGNVMPGKDPRDYNRIILTEEDYRTLIEDANYWKCDYCGTINNTSISQCPICGAARKETSRVTQGKEEEVEVEDFSEEELLDEQFGRRKRGLMNSFLKLPDKVQYLIIALVLGLGTIYLPWSVIPYGQWGQLLVGAFAFLFGYLIFHKEVTD